MENYEKKPQNLDDDKKALIAEINKIGDEKKDIVKMAKALGYKRAEKPEEALEFVIQSIKDAKDQDDFQTIRRKFNNLDEIEV
jgi:hypothetical protein